MTFFTFPLFIEKKHQNKTIHVYECTLLLSMITGHLCVPFRPRLVVESSTGPSCSNNNDIFLRRTFSRDSPGHTRVDSMYTGKYGSMEAEKGSARTKGRRSLLDSLYVQGRTNSSDTEHARSCSPKPRLITSSRRPSLPPECPSSPRRRCSKPKFMDRPRDRSTGDVPIPYMVSLHPYNWATSNNSAIHPSSPHDKGGLFDTAPFPPDDNENNEIGCTRKEALLADLDCLLGVDGGGLERPKQRTSLEPTISYSRSPASASKYSRAGSTNTSDFLEHGFPFEADGIMARRAAPQKRSKLPVPRHGIIYNRAMSPNETRKVKGNAIEQRGSSGNESPRKKAGRRIQYSTPINTRLQQSPERKKFEKYVTFQENEGDFQEAHKNSRSASQSPKTSPTRKRYPADNLTENRKPMYYDRLSENYDNRFSGVESGEDYTYPSPNCSPRSNRFRMKNTSPTSTSFELSQPLGARDSSPVLNRLPGSLSLSNELCSAGQEPPDLTCSRYELLELRDAVRVRDFLLSPEPLHNRMGTYSPDSLEASPLLQGRSFETPFSKISSSSYSRDTNKSARIPDGRSLSTNTSMASIARRPSGSAPSKLGSPPQRTRPGSPREKTVASGTALRKSTEASVSGKKTHRSPNYARLTIAPELRDKRTQEWIRDMSRPGKAPKSPSRADIHINENANRALTSSSSFEVSPAHAKEDDRAPFLKRLLEWQEESVMDQLLEEKRELDRKHEESLWKSHSAPPSPWFTTCPEDQNGQPSSFSEPCVGESYIRPPKSPKQSPKTSQKAAVSARQDTVHAEELSAPVESPIDLLRRETVKLREETEK